MAVAPQAPAFIATAARPLPCTKQPGLFHAPEGGAGADGRFRAAVDLCLDCPLMIACRDWAREHRQPGVWGGETDEERTAAGYASTLLAPTTQRPRPPCGTQAGAMWHRRYDTTGVCIRCRQAASDAERRRKEVRRREIAAEWPPRLTDREKELLSLLAISLSRKEIAQRMGISRKSVDVNVTRIRAKLRVFEIDDLVRVGREHGGADQPSRELAAA
ncbi:LuxR C-terminal-related transcriptional regulator [Streptomyces luteocolor]|uniref:LuxR C-terminal-related transcriptional regulator n=1 Tax=Streptomyces luteocolor TaxID=285500 RepID=UPI000852F1FE|nr:LuxR C-terminal-related transcriptional regulator [Streptomyces luteocolor]